MAGIGMSGGNNTANRRTGLLLGAVALVFFVAIILRYWLSK